MFSRWKKKFPALIWYISGWRDIILKLYIYTMYVRRSLLMHAHVHVIAYIASTQALDTNYFRAILISLCTCIQENFTKLFRDCIHSDNNNTPLHLNICVRGAFFFFFWTCVLTWTLYINWCTRDYQFQSNKYIDRWAVYVHIYKKTSLKYFVTISIIIILIVTATYSTQFYKRF